VLELSLLIIGRTRSAVRRRNDLILENALLGHQRDMRLTLVLRYYLDLPFDEIGRVLKCSSQAAKSRTDRALAKLRVEIPEELGP